MIQLVGLNYGCPSGHEM